MMEEEHPHGLKTLMAYEPVLAAVFFNIILK
jgi:hypothetical protein